MSEAQFDGVILEKKPSMTITFTKLGIEQIIRSHLAKNIQGGFKEEDIKIFFSLEDPHWVEITLK